MNMKFLKEFEKEASKMEQVSSISSPPRFFFSYGNHVINRLMTGSFYKGVPQGRITAIAGPSHAGKSFIAGNLIREVQKEGGFNLVIDTENAFDDNYIRKIGGNPDDPNYNYKSTLTIPSAARLVNFFITKYKEEYKDNLDDAPRGLITIDSLDSMFTEAEWEAYDKKGELKADQGLQSKQLKGMLLKFQQDIKNLNIAIVVTKQVYKAKQEQLLQGEGIWVVNDAIRYPCSQILLVSRLKLRDTESTISRVYGIRMRCEGFKTRFTKPFQTATVEVPYDTGMDPYNGLFEVALELDVIIRSGGWYQLSDDDKKWRKTEFHTYADTVLQRCEEKGSEFLEANIDNEEIDTSNQISARSKKTQRLVEATTERE